MKIAIIGTGYVGLVTGVCFAELGVDVVCVDRDSDKIEKLKNGVNPIYEPGLDELLENVISTGRLTFSTSMKDSIKDVEMVFSAVGTPPLDDGSADLRSVYDVAKELGESMDSYKLLVIKSTVPVGTCHKSKEIVEQELRNRGVDIEFDVASNPEFLKEGDAINDFMRPDRVVIGAESERARELLTKLYRPLQLSRFRVIFMDILSAEMTKYASNSMLATRISFMNDIANLCDIVGGDINMVRRGVGSDSRIGDKFLYAGVGYGGSCFPKDIKALIQTARQNDYQLSVLEAVDAVNERQKTVLFDKLLSYFNGDLSGRKIALWGLSFKPHTDDVREATSIVLTELITAAGASVVAFDPIAMKNFDKLLRHRASKANAINPAAADMVRYVKEKYEALDGADALVVVTEWKEFRIPSLVLITKLMKTPVLFDGRNVYDRKELENEGITYINIGSNTLAREADISK